jgi:membrane associated rhomboid family serine protease
MDRDYWRDNEGRPSTFWSMYPATKAILIGLAAIYLGMRLAGRAGEDAITDLLALSPKDVLQRFRVWQLVTYCVVHGSVWHLFFNGLGIWFFGRLVEQRLGVRRYLMFALGTVVTGSLGFLLLAAFEDRTSSMVGASAFDFGALVLAALWYPRMTILVFFVLAMPLWLAASIFAFLEVATLLDHDGIAHAAHLGGALYAFLWFRYGERFAGLLAGLDRWQERRRRRRAEAEHRQAEQLRGEVDRILDKVNREGMAALTDAERRALKDASARLRR